MGEGLEILILVEVGVGYWVEVFYGKLEIEG